MVRPRTPSAARPRASTSPSLRTSTASTSATRRTRSWSTQIEAIAPEIEAAKEFSGSIDEAGWSKLKKAMPGLKERAKTLVELLVSARYLFVKRPARHRREGRQAPGGRRAQAPRRTACALLGAGGVGAGRARSRDARLCGGGGSQARRRGPALARRAHRPHHLAAHLRRAPCARPRRRALRASRIKSSSRPARVASGPHFVCIGEWRICLSTCP